MKIEVYLRDKKQIVESGLERLMLAAHGPFSDHIEAMRYSLFVGGKRIRPVLCLAAAEAVSDDSRLLEALVPVACAIECIHTYSLIHDDLPAMDDDELRRGRPTNHIIFGEAGAILAGDALLTFAFELLSTPIIELAPEAQLRIINLIARAAGAEGMAGGQALDIAGENSELPFEKLQTIHSSKTGALIRCCLDSRGDRGRGWPGPAEMPERLWHRNRPRLSNRRRLTRRHRHHRTARQDRGCGSTARQSHLSRLFRHRQDQTSCSTGRRRR